MLEEINDYSPDKVTSICDGAHFLSNQPTPVCENMFVWLYLTAFGC